MPIQRNVVLYASVYLLITVLGNNALDLLKPRIAAMLHPITPNVQCRCLGYPNQTICSWAQPLHTSLTHYIATCSERKNQMATTQCRLLPPDSSLSAVSMTHTASGQLWHCQLEDLKLLTDYILNVTAVNTAGSSTRLISFMLEDIVKPDPPADVQAFPNSFRKSLSVHWAPPPTWSNLDIFPLKYHIRYQWDHKGRTRTAHHGPLENTRVDLKGLAKGVIYRVDVCAMDLLGLGECSPWSTPVEATMA